MRALLEVLNHPAEAFRNRHRSIALALVMIAILINAVIEPLLQFLWGIGKPEPDILSMLQLIGVGMLSYLCMCFILWIVGKGFGSKATFLEHVSSWGLTYIPTAICAITVALTEVFFEIFWNNSIWGLLINIVFGTILIWKMILYMIYLRELVNLRSWRYAAAFVIIGLFIVMLAVCNASLGLKTPVL